MEKRRKQQGTDKGAEKNALAGRNEDVGNAVEDSKEGTENDDENDADDNAQIN